MNEEQIFNLAKDIYVQRVSRCTERLTEDQYIKLASSSFCAAYAFATEAPAWGHKKDEQ